MEFENFTTANWFSFIGVLLILMFVMFLQFTGSKKKEERRKRREEFEDKLYGPHLRNKNDDEPRN